MPTFARGCSRPTSCSSASRWQSRCWRAAPTRQTHRRAGRERVGAGASEGFCCSVGAALAPSCAAAAPAGGAAAASRPWLLQTPCRRAPTSPQLLDFFIKGNLSLEPRPRPCPHSWLPGQAWQDALALSELSACKKDAEGGPQAYIRVVTTAGVPWRMHVWLGFRGGVCMRRRPCGVSCHLTLSIGPRGPLPLAAAWN